MNGQHGKLSVSDYTRPVVCDFCLGDKFHNRDGVSEEMLVCSDCPAKAHPTCMKYSKSLAKKALSYSWQCIECKTCTVCSSAEHGERILFCDACDKAYHMNCHQPPIEEHPKGNWLCNSCTQEAGDLVAVHDNKAPDESPPSLPQVKVEVNASLQNGHDISDDVKSWTPAQVAAYIDRHGFKKQAPVFNNEEIDGQSLLLLRRSDVISKLSLKLGPAVKIYQLVSALQSKSVPSSM